MCHRLWRNCLGEAGPRWGSPCASASTLPLVYEAEVFVRDLERNCTGAEGGSHGFPTNIGSRPDL